MDFSSLIPFLAAKLGFDPVTLLFYIGLLVTIANSIAKYIPNTATGPLGVIRSICGVIGIYISSRVAPGVTMADTASAVIATPATAMNLPSTQPPPAGSVTTSTGAKLSSPWFVAAAVLVLMLFLGACATLSGASNAQKLYAAFGAYDVALHEATDYATTPGANPDVVHVLDQVNKDAQPAVLFARAFRPCTSGATVFQGTSCSTFDFSTAGILADIAQLQKFTTSLQAR